VSHLSESLREPVLRQSPLRAAWLAGVQQRLTASRVMSSACW
jgi:hypothetical protein